MKVVVVILAAGESSRTSKMKQLYRVDDEYLVNRQIKIIQSYGYEVAVVLGHRFEEISAILQSDIKVIQNPHYREGMFSSVKSAFNTLKADRIIFCHVDRPMVSKDIFEKLIQSKNSIATLSHKKKNAPPIMIKHSMKKELLASTHKRLDYWIESTNIAQRIEVSDESVHFNANTDKKLERYFS